jgi:two-component system sensor histidine kinase DesK
MSRVASVAAWWAGRSEPQRVALYTRWTYYGALALTPLDALLIVGSSAHPRPIAAGLFVLGSVAVAVMALCLARVGLGCDFDRRLPRQLLAGAWVLALGTAVTAAFVLPESGQKNSALSWWLFLPPTVVLIACSTVWSTGILTLAGAGIGALVGVVLLSVGHPAPEALVLGVTLGCICTAIVLSFRFSAWVLQVVAELERAREIQARLAVAEERLRFARDLHDVMGRNLSAIAVKGQLAGELVRRGRPEAAAEVGDISRIAEESLREIRGVVGGYRSASLPGELAGARAVLRAAGVSCTVSGDDQGAGLAAPMQATLGWVVREAVTNVLRHSRATTCTLTLSTMAGAAELQVINDGALAPVDRAWGNGLTGLSERLDAAGGRLTTARDDGRFALTATLPLAPNR